MNKPKILVLDIETRPTVAYVWRMYDENISPEQIIEEGGVICFCAHWHGTKDYFFYSSWEDGHLVMLQAAHNLIEEADAVVTYNGDKFDLPKLSGEFLLAGMKPPAPPTSIDVLKTIKKQGFVMNRLAHIGPLLKVGNKIKHEGFALWRDLLEGDDKAKIKMKRYCIQDVKLLDKLYKTVLPYIKNHPHLGERKPNTCGACGSKNIHKRGYRRTKYFKIQRIQCQDCGSWEDLSRVKI